MQYVGFNFNSGVQEWYSTASIRSLVKVSEDKIIIELNNDTSLKLVVANADDTIDQLTTSEEKRIEITCEDQF